MDALIYLDLEALHPVVDGKWHRVDLHRVPMPGEKITMLCGVKATAEFVDLVRRRDYPPQQCWDCDGVYRLRKGIAPPHGVGAPRSKR